MCESCTAFRESRKPPPRLRDAADYSKPGRSLFRAQRHLAFAKKQQPDKQPEETQE